MNADYQLINIDTVRIMPEAGEPFPIKQGDLKVAIGNVKGDRQFFKTQAAYERMLAMYENALRFLDAHQEKTNEPDPCC